jgi:hypothetical protein
MLQAVIVEMENHSGASGRIATAVAEKLSASQTAEFFAGRRERADFRAFDKLMKRRGGKPPRAGDEMPGPPSKRASQRSR